MLDTTEILALERRWKRYKYKALFKRSIFAIAIFSVTCLSTLYYLGFLTIPHQKIDTVPTTVTNKNSTSSKINDPIVIKKASVVDDNLSTIKEPIVTQEAHQNTNEVLQLKPIIVEQPQKKINTQALLPQKPIQTVQKEIQQTTQSIQKDEIESSTVPIITASAKKNKIKITTEEVETTTYLKEKFYTTHNIVFALMLAEEYYHLEDYNNALKWSLTANEINPENERSWILFAKAKAKKGSPQEALKALEAFHKTSPSSKITALIQKLKHGEI